MDIQTQTEKGSAAGSETKESGFFARQPLSTLGKIALWTSFIGFLGALGGTIALAITSGTPSRDIVTLTVCVFASFIILATRFRWAPAVSIMPGGYGLFLIFTEPFVIESLANPKGPNGGYGHFIGDVIVIANAIIAFVACAGAALQNYHVIGHSYPRWFNSVLGGVAGLVIGASFLGAVAQPPVTGLTYTNGVPTIHMNAGNFALSSATISKGSKLLLIDDTTSQHLLSNGTWQRNTPVQQREPGAPLIKNLSLSGNSVTIGPFATAGTYHIYCSIHQGMNLTINVQ